MDENPEQKSSLTGLASKLSKLPADKRRAAVEVRAALAGVSLRVSREFVESVPLAAKVLSADDLRAWGEFGRRLAMGNAETGSKFFSAGVEQLSKVPKKARGFVFQICTRQLVLSSSISLETFEMIPKLVDQINDDELLADILRLALDIAHRSAKHSSDFLKQTPPVAREIATFGDSKDAVSSAIIILAANFANRTGGMTADLWTNLPSALRGLSAENAVQLASRSSDFLEHGGSVTLHFVSAGGDVLRNEPSVFQAWCGVLESIAPGGNAVLIAFLRATPKFFKQIKGLKLNGADSGILKTAAVARVIALAGEIAATDAESSLAAFRSSASALRSVSLDQYEQWIRTGLDQMREESTK